MGVADRRTRPAPITAVVLAVVALLAGPAPVQALPLDLDLTDVVDIDDFENRADRWNEARRRARQQALERAEELAAEARTTTTTAAPATTAAPTTTEPPTTTETPTTTAAPTTTEPSTTTEAPAVQHEIPAGTTEAQWHALRQCESTQNYQAVSSSGRYRGAYQFSIRTWDWVAGKHYPELVGVDPRDASPPDQDKMAYRLYQINGWDPWPTCKKRLPS